MQCVNKEIIYPIVSIATLYLQEDIRVWCVVCACVRASLRAVGSSVHRVVKPRHYLLRVTRI
jgi:hypothetical protein